MINTLVLTYSEDGVAEATDHNYGKSTYEKNRGEFINQEWTAAGGIGRNDLILTITPPKPSASSFGVTRLESNLGQALNVPNPLGATSPAVATAKTNISLPEGITPEEKLEFLQRLQAWVNSTEFENFVLLKSY